MPESQTPAANKQARLTSKQERHAQTLWYLKMLGFVIITVCVLSLPSQYAVERPGPVVNTLGEVTVDGESTPVLEISGAKQHPPEGTLNLLTVNVQGAPDSRVPWVGLLWPLLDPAQAIVPLNNLYPSGQTSDERKQVNQAQMTSSQDDATAAALRAQGYDVPGTVTVGYVGDGLPAAGILEPNDEILAVDDNQIDGLGSLRAAINAANGKPVQVTFLREGETQPRTQMIVPEELSPGEWMIGVSVSTTFEFPVTVNFVLEDIGGPSAGMIFSLAIIDELSPGELTQGNIVSGTGTIDDTGAVGGIGGLQQKMYAAADAETDLFIMPKANCGDVPKKIPGDMTVAVVDSLEQAQSAIETFNSGEPVVGTEACEVS